MTRKNVRITALIRVSEGASYAENTLSQKEVTIVGTFERADYIAIAMQAAARDALCHVNEDIKSIAIADAECKA